MKLFIALSTFLFVLIPVTWAEVDEWDKQIETYCSKPLSQGKKRPCIKFVKGLEKSASTAREWTVIGTSYSWMIDFEQALEVREVYQKKAIKAFQTANEIDPANANAWLGLATNSDTRSEKLDYLRNAYYASPERIFVATTLVNEIRNSDNPTEADYDEVSNILDSTYESAKGYDKWRMVMLADSDSPRGSALVNRARSDALLKFRAVDIVKSSDQALSSVFEEFCAIPIFNLQLADSCYSLLSSIIARKSNTEFLSERSVLAIGRILSAKDELGHRDPELLIRMRDFLEQLVENEHNSVELYLQYARVTTGIWRLANLKRAVEISEESNAKALLWLGVELAKQGKAKAAKSSLKRSERLNQEPYSGVAKFELSALVGRQRH